MDESEANDLAKRLGLDPPERVGTVIPGVPGVDDLRQQVEDRLRSSGGRPTDLSWNKPRRIPFKDDMWLALQGLAQHLSTSNRRVAAGQVAALIIEDRLRTIALQPPGEEFNIDDLPLPDVGLRAPASYEQEVEHLTRQLDELRKLRRREQTFAPALQALRSLRDQAEQLDPIPTVLIIRLYLEYSTSARHLGKSSFIVAEDAVARAKQIAEDNELPYWVYRCEYESLRLLILKEPTTTSTLKERCELVSQIRAGLKGIDNTEVDLAWIFHTEGEIYRQAAADSEDAGLFAAAQRRYQVALRRFADAGDSYGAANANERLAVCAINLNNPRRAIYHADAAFETARRVGFGRTEMRARVVRLHAEGLQEAEVPNQLERLVAELDAAGYEPPLKRLVKVRQEHSTVEA